MELFWLLLAPTYAISVFAVALSLRTYRNARLYRRMTALESDLASLETLYEKLLKSYRNLNSRVAMRDVRKSQKENPRGEETPDEWKARMRRELAMKRSR